MLDFDDHEKNAPHDPTTVFLWATTFEIGLGLIALIVGWIIGPDARELLPQLSNDSVGLLLWQILIGCAASLPMVALVALLLRLPFEPIREITRLSEDDTMKALLRLTPIELIVISACAGVGEELLFRGWLLPFLAGGSNVLEQPTIAIGASIIGSSILFGLVHPITKLYVVLAGFMGVYFAFLMLATGSLLIPIATHACYDAIQLLIASRQSRQQPSQIKR
ncbi:CPBP family intramembrane glutamic endopeptidase [Stieleria varia]|uniref:CAAX amino terminal protease self-immunity n=1 Tax=Stieleria varia TaxID=2528005 RepID=A0A5C6A1Z3_9BACT|nr:CPBP family intramembrane glutamic endopeptidase [Stieleria varia]TWT93874.1 CAAX amino terminal protease self- immunity [Stieleria varia]